MARCCGRSICTVMKIPILGVTPLVHRRGPGQLKDTLSTSRRPSAHQSSRTGKADRAGDDVMRQIDQAEVVAAGVAAERLEGLVDADVEVARHHTLGLLDDDPAV